MARAQTPAVLAVEVLVEEHEVAPMRIPGVADVVAMAGTLPILVREEQPREARRQLARYLAEGHHAAGADRTLDCERVSIEMVIPLQRLDEQVVHRKPERTAPVRVAAEQAARAFARRIIDAELLAARAEDEGMVPVGARDGAEAIRREKLGFVEQVAKHPCQPLARRDCQEAVRVHLASLT